MMYDLITFETYFKEKKGNMGIAEVVVGGYNELIQLQASSIRYPVLVLETPEIEDDVDDYFTFKTRIAVLDKWADTRKTADYKGAMNACKQILEDVFTVMRADKQRLTFNPKKIQYEFIERGQMVSSDALFGAIAPEIEFVSFMPCE